MNPNSPQFLPDPKLRATLDYFERKYPTPKIHRSEETPKDAIDGELWYEPNGKVHKRISGEFMHIATALNFP